MSGRHPPAVRGGRRRGVPGELSWCPVVASFRHLLEALRSPARLQVCLLPAPPMPVAPRGDCRRSREHRPPQPQGTRTVFKDLHGALILKKDTLWKHHLHPHLLRPSEGFRLRLDWRFLPGLRRVHPATCHVLNPFSSTEQLGPEDLQEAVSGRGPISSRPPTSV